MDKKYDIKNFQRIDGIIEGREGEIQSFVYLAAENNNLPDPDKLILICDEHFIEIKDERGLSYITKFLTSAYDNNGICETLIKDLEGDAYNQSLWYVYYNDLTIASGQISDFTSIDISGSQLKLEDGWDSLTLDFSKIVYVYADFDGDNKEYHFKYDNDVEVVMSLLR